MAALKTTYLRRLISRQPLGVNRKVSLNVDAADAVVIVVDEICTFSFSSLNAVFSMPIPPSVIDSPNPLMLSDDAERFFRTFLAL